MLLELISSGFKGICFLSSTLNLNYPKFKANTDWNRQNMLNERTEFFIRLVSAAPLFVFKHHSIQNVLQESLCPRLATRSLIKLR